MEDDGRGFGNRTPKRQLVYPFVELYDQHKSDGQETENVVQSLIDELS